MAALIAFGFVLLCTFAVWEATPQRPGTRDELRILAAALAAIIILAGLSVLALPASAHPADTLDEWRADWTARLETSGMSRALAAEYRDMIERHPAHFRPELVEPPPPSRAVARRVTVPGSVEHWRPLVSEHFQPADVDRALCLIYHESQGDPQALNPSSGAAGLFQVMPFWWDAYPGDRFDPETNISLAALIRDSQGWTAWAPYNRGECR